MGRKGALIVGIALLGLLALLAVQLTGLAPSPQAAPTPTPGIAPSQQEQTVPPTTPLPTSPASEASPAHVEESLAFRVDAIMAGMSLAEKVGQLFLVWFEGPDLSPALAEMITEYHVGGIVLFNIAGNVESPAQLTRLINDAQAVATLPLLVAVDQEGGPVARLTTGFTHFPSQMAVGATDDPDATRSMAEVMAAEMQAVGVNMVLGPVMDVNNNPDNPVIGIRSFSSDPDRVSRLGQAMIEAYDEVGIIATAKHFPGHGDTAIDSHFGLPVIPHSREHLDTIELPPFRAAIEQNVPAIMTAHVLLSALDEERPATLSPAVLQGLLREELGYEGLIVTDSLGMAALTQQYGPGEIGLLAFQAGADVLAYGADIAATVADQQAAYQRILAAAESGEISPERLDASVRRILLAKLAYGLFYHPPLDPDEAATLTGSPAHQAVARDLAEASITLVRDENGLFPPAQEGQMLVVYPASLPQFGEALASCRPDLMLRPVPLNPTATDVEAILADSAIAAQVVVATVNARRHPAQVQLVDALNAGAVSERLAVVALQEPYDLLAFPHISTYLATYGNGDVSLHALARALCGAFSPAGRLPVTLPGQYDLGWRAPKGDAAPEHWSFLPIMTR